MGKLTWDELGAVVHWVYEQERARGGSVTVERIDQVGAAVLAVAGGSASGREAIHTTRAEESSKMAKIVAQNTKGAFRPCGRPDPTPATDQELVEALNAPGAEHVLALTNETTGKTAFVKNPVPYFDLEDYRRRTAKQHRK
jgi:hypothetical protein